MLTGEFLDPPALATSLLPAASSEFDHTSRVAQHTPPGSPLPRRRRPALQRRLGGFHIPLPTPTKELANQTPIQTANHPPSNHRRPQHPLRPIPRRARCSRNRPRDLRRANLRRHRRIQRPESRRHSTHPHWRSLHRQSAGRPMALSVRQRKVLRLFSPPNLSIPPAWAVSTVE